MENLINTSLSAIAKHLGVRLVRLNDKIEKLKLDVKDDNTLTKNNALVLVRSYMNSNKTSAVTKKKAEILLERIENRIPLSSNLPKQKVSMPYRKSKRSSKKMHIKYLKLYMNTSKYILYTFEIALEKLLYKGVQMLESVYFKFFALIVAICVQMHHSANLFYRTSTESPSWLAAIGYAFMLDLFILVVAMEGKVHIAKTFAVLTFFANVLYFRFWTHFDGTLEAYTDAVSSLLISATMSFICYSYTELFVHSHRKMNIQET